jgi:serine/threonine-protein kinase RsbW
MKRSKHEQNRRVLGRVKREDFVGRAAELERLLSHVTHHAPSATSGEANGLLILLAPLAGVSELLRQTYDELFSRRADTVPIYFSLPREETTAVSAAIEFLNTFLLQYVAYRRDEPALCQSSLTLGDVVRLAPAADLPWIEALIESYEKQRFSSDDREFVRFCLTAPQRILPGSARVTVLFDAVQLSAYSDSSVPLATEIIRALRSGTAPFVLAGLRREVLDVAERAGANSAAFDIMRLEKLSDEDARALVTATARKQQVSINDETRDLLVQQLESSPFFITTLLQAAREKHLSLNSYLACERLYVDEILGGRLNRYFGEVLERLAPEAKTRGALVRMLCESVPAGSGRISFEACRQRLDVDSGEAAKILRGLHVHEFVNWDGDSIDAEAGPIPWKDYLRSRFRLDALREPRALVVADVIATSLKRAPQTIARYYRRAAGLQLRELLGRFNSQRVPATLFHYDEFAAVYKGMAPESVAMGLDAEKDLLRLPEVFYTASGVSYSSELKQFGEESCVVAHGFDGATYADASEIVWLVAKVESKLEANRYLTELWLDRLEGVARRSGFLRTRIWLIANEGFSAAALDLLSERNAYGSGKQQFELLTTRLSEGAAGMMQTGDIDEVEMILPMGGDYEVLAATTAEQIARRLSFRPEAINQIKTAIVEACINASEHSLSLDRKIYQRFRVENDKLVITIASRGIVPSNIEGLRGDFEEMQAASGTRSSESGESASKFSDASDERRGWGLKLIKTLMDEVEFERVDEGTRLTMTKYLRP